jgi:hypothetical protein
MPIFRFKAASYAQVHMNNDGFMGEFGWVWAGLWNLDDGGFDECASSLMHTDADEVCLIVFARIEVIEGTREKNERRLVCCRVFSFPYSMMTLPHSTILSIHPTPSRHWRSPFSISILTNIKHSFSRSHGRGSSQS